ncbi:FAD/NAD(P)-binding protein [Winogradskyella echinorum]|uniref:FAD/NAD(P)-binding protein n=1 Tax=Winogradskyella echinorum TaxID=538189 RepID=A0ABR6Y0Z9_9FLAO|nr:FAD/NAD(P)-binding protein [Winogradskyella echinorum]MBC3846407.1 FAD/NAD(P)-binding protein [Winogradskyella echinorum]MBC5750755.1 FAD/NAD(P)-binding protein [Winogradskyella echinorum]
MKTLAIIGMGPRGLYALENLLTQLAKTNQAIEILVFEACELPGSGNVWNHNQPDTNWINITERALSGLKERPQINYNNILIDGFPSYHNWCDFSQTSEDPDQFPPRRKLGIYLNERFNSIAKALRAYDRFKVINSKIIAIELNENYTVKIESTKNTWLCNDVLLTVGHQPTKPSKQLEKWEAHVNTFHDLKLFNEPYPVTELDHIRNKEHIVIGIRGFGLAMIDVMRYLAVNNYGNFKVTDSSTLETVYYKTKEQNLKLVPFSLDGLPMGPKPLNENIDNWYKPNASQLDFIRNKIEAFTNTEKDANTIDFLIQPLAEIGAQIFEQLNNKAVDHSLNSDTLKSVILDFLSDADYSHHLIQNSNISTYNLIRSYVNMALGNTKISLDYCIWQVWRHCQPMLYKTISHAKLSNETMNKIIDLDERSKRFSYGPPLESLQQILALADAKVLDLDYTNNPDIKLTENGWELKNKANKTLVCDIMVNSVLDSPQLLKINSPLIVNLLKNELIQPVHTDLGIETQDDGYVVSDDKNKQVPIAILGRIVKGSVLGVDAILECFGKRVEDWADGYVKRLNS